MKAILLSIKPKYVAKILNGENTIEVRKSMPKCELPIDVYIYCTKGKPYFFESDWSDNDGKYSVLPNDLNKAIEYVKSKPRYGDEYIGWSYVLYGTPYGNLFEKRKYYSGKVVAKFTLNKVEEISYNYRSDYTSVYTDTLDTEDLEKQACLERHEFAKYLKGEIGYAWRISNLVIFDKPKELSEFYPYCKDEKCEYRNNHCSVCRRTPLTKAPQSWCYIESEK